MKRELKARQNEPKTGQNALLRKIWNFMKNEPTTSQQPAKMHFWEQLGHLKKFNEKRTPNEPKRAKHQPKCSFQTAYMIHGPAPP